MNLEGDESQEWKSFSWVPGFQIQIYSLDPLCGGCELSASNAINHHGQEISYFRPAPAGRNAASVAPWCC
jgi:hypothetical protein